MLINAYSVVRNGEPIDTGAKLLLGRRNMLTWKQVFKQIEERANFPADAVAKVNPLRVCLSAVACSKECTLG